MTPRNVPEEARKVFEGKIFSVWQWDQTVYDGSTKVFEKITRPDTVYVLPVLPDNSLLLIEDEQPHREMVLTIPRGRAEIGEEPEAVGRRELLEETGHEVKELVAWGVFEPWGKVSWTIYFYIGRGAQKVTEPQPESGERITFHPVSVDQFVELAASGALQDPWLQITLLQAKLDPKKMDEFKHLLYAQ